MRELKVLSLFSGIGAFEKALDNVMEEIGGGYRLVNYCEIDDYASKSYSLVHNVNEKLNLWDVTKIDTTKLPKDIDFITHGSPCQDFSLAGRQAGGDEGSGTRSSLMYETVRIVKDVMPKIVVWENVKNVLSKKHVHNFNSYIDTMSEIGYNSYYKVLNAKDYGIPQNRERIFVVSIRKDIDDGNFKFPEPMELKLRLKDMLEDDVDESYYLSEDKISRIAHWKAYQKPFKRVLGKNSISPTLTTRGAGEEHSGMITYCEELDNTTDLQEECLNIKDTAKLIKVGDLQNNDYVVGDFRYDEGFRPRKNGLCPCLTTKVGGTSLSANPLYVTRREEVMENKVIQDGYIKKGENGKKHQSNTVYDAKCNDSMGVVDKNLCIRTLTPRECWRLMGFDDSDFNKVKDEMSKTQLYKQAGNSIVVNVLEGIYRELFNTTIFK